MMTTQMPRHTGSVKFIVNVPKNDKLSEIRNWVQFCIEPKYLAMAANVQLDFKVMSWTDTDPDMQPAEFLNMLVNITPEALLKQFSEKSCFDFAKTINKLSALRPDLAAQIQKIPYVRSASRFGEQYIAIENASANDLFAGVSLDYPAIDDAIAKIFVKYAVPKLKEIYYE